MKKIRAKVDPLRTFKCIEIAWLFGFVELGTEFQERQIGRERGGGGEEEREGEKE